MDLCRWKTQTNERSAAEPEANSQKLKANG
jgi:hypothetical protein